MMRAESTPELSVVVPVHSEIEVLPQLCSRLKSTLQSMGVTHEVIFVDDGSEDESGQWLTQWGENHCPGMILVVLSRCFGKESAVSAGLKQSIGKTVVVMDADLQDPPELIHDMYQTLQGDIDVVAMRRSDRRSDSLMKRTTAKTFYRLMNLAGNVDTPEDVGDFRIMTRQVVNALNSLPEQNRCMKTLFSWVGFRCEFIEFVRPERGAGETKWSVSALVRLAADSITAHSLVPLRLATLVGFVVALMALFYGALTVLKTLVLGEPVAGYTTMLLFTTLLGGIQLIAIGILGEYVGRCYIETKRRPLYLVRRTIRPRPGASRVKVIGHPQIDYIHSQQSATKHTQLRDTFGAIQ